jgi:3'(2'), 5'-bisphosphate nucleotidase
VRKADLFDIHNTEIKFALQAVRQAALLVRRIQTELVVSAQEKEDRSPVTVADYASQALVAHMLAESFSRDVLVAEEDASSLVASPLLEQVTAYVRDELPTATPESICSWIDRGASVPTGRFWTLDPIDGTKGFLRGDQYAVALALVEQGQVQIGILGCPNLRDGYRPDHGGEGTLAVAVRGQGSWITSLVSPQYFDRLQASRRSDPSTARLLRSFESGHTNPGQIDRLATALGNTTNAVAMDSQAKYCVLASGKADLMLRLLSPSRPDYREKIWDQAAGLLIIEEAGGMVTDLDGKALDLSTGRTLAKNRGVLASNGLLHPAVLQALRAMGA